MKRGQQPEEGHEPVPGINGDGSAAAAELGEPADQQRAGIVVQADVIAGELTEQEQQHADTTEEGDGEGAALLGAQTNTEAQPQQQPQPPPPQQQTTNNDEKSNDDDSDRSTILHHRFVIGASSVSIVMSCIPACLLGINMYNGFVVSNTKPAVAASFASNTTDNGGGASVACSNGLQTVGAVLESTPGAPAMLISNAMLALVAGVGVILFNCRCCWFFGGGNKNDVTGLWSWLRTANDIAFGAGPVVFVHALVTVLEYMARAPLRAEGDRDAFSYNMAMLSMFVLSSFCQVLAAAVVRSSALSAPEMMS